MDTSSPDGVVIRSWEKGDQSACAKLYIDGLLGGKLADNDTGLDIDDIDLAYMRSPGSHFWVAQITASGEIVGMIGVQQHDEGAGEIRRLRVRAENRGRGVGLALLAKAVEFCRDRGYLKVTLDTFIDREPALRLFEQHHFRHERTRESGGKQLLFFYLDLYGGAKGSERRS